MLSSRRYNFRSITTSLSSLRYFNKSPLSLKIFWSKPNPFYWFGTPLWNGNLSIIKKMINYFRLPSRSFRSFNNKKSIFCVSSKENGSINFHEHKKKNCLNGNVSFLSAQRKRAQSSRSRLPSNFHNSFRAQRSDRSSQTFPMSFNKVASLSETKIHVLPQHLCFT